MHDVQSAKKVIVLQLALQLDLSCLYDVVYSVLFLCFSSRFFPLCFALLALSSRLCGVLPDTYVYFKSFFYHRVL